MVEELKIVADIMSDVADGALKGVIAYLIFAYVKPVTITGVISLVIYKVTKLIVSRPKESVNAIKLIDELQNNKD